MNEALSVYTVTCRLMMALSEEVFMSSPLGPLGQRMCGAQRIRMKTLAHTSSQIPLWERQKVQVVGK